MPDLVDVVGCVHALLAQVVVVVDEVDVVVARLLVVDYVVVLVLEVVAEAVVDVVHVAVELRQRSFHADGVANEELSDFGERQHNV